MASTPSATSPPQPQLTPQLIFQEKDLLCPQNNFLHHTSEFSTTELIVRRGQPFDLNLILKEPCNPLQKPIVFGVATGSQPTQEQGTLAFFSIPDGLGRIPQAKVVWKLEHRTGSDPSKKNLFLSITPPADAPIGKYFLKATHKNHEELVTELVVLYNAWCPDDSVYMEQEEERQEYVMNEQGIIFKGSAHYLFPEHWDYAQFEDNMVPICLKILDLNPKCLKDPGADAAARSDPVYVGRVVSAMINCQDDKGVLWGQWGGPYTNGECPTHWSDSYTILKKWYESDAKAVKYGQCWVFAAVMNSVMRALGMPCRVITNFASAHDNDMDLIIDKFYDENGDAMSHLNQGSIWNFHVWVEGYAKRPDLLQGSRFDGWQVMDPTPQERSEGVYCCGPVPTKAILEGCTDVKYDCPFVFAEVNADVQDWQINSDGTKTKVKAHTGRVGKNISTKAVGSNDRCDVTSTYKYKEGSEKEREVFFYAYDLATVEEGGDDDDMEEGDDNAGTEEGDNEDHEDTVEVEDNVEGEDSDEPDDNDDMEDEGPETGGTEGEEEENEEPIPEVVIKFKQVTTPINGKDVKLKVLLKCKVERKLSVKINVDAAAYNDSACHNIKFEEKEVKLEAGTALPIPILVPFSAYHALMVEADVMRVIVLITDKEKPENKYLDEVDVVLKPPPLKVKVFGKVKRFCWSRGMVTFKNPADEVLTKCRMTLAGSGLWHGEVSVNNIPDMKPKAEIRVRFFFKAYKEGEKTIVADFDCATFRDIKGICRVTVKDPVPL